MNSAGVSMNGDPAIYSLFECNRIQKSPVLKIFWQPLMRTVTRRGLIVLCVIFYALLLWRSVANAQTQRPDILVIFGCVVRRRRHGRLDPEHRLHRA